MSEQQNNAVATVQPKKSLVATIAAQYDMEPQPFLDAITQTVMPTTVQTSNAMVAAFLLVCNEHGLNPFTREIFAFPTKTGGIQPIVSIDGWVKLVNQHPQFDGMELEMKIDEKTGKPISCTCTIHRKDRQKATPITEYYDECYRNTDPWNKMPKRMMRHKALKEAARYTFGFAGIMDEDEGRDAINITAESTVIAKETMTKTEQLKEKIGAKKAEKEKKEVPPAPVANESWNDAVKETPPPPVEEHPAPAPEPTPGNLEAFKAHNDKIIANGLKGEEDFPEQPQEDMERLLTDEERNAILAALKSHAKSKEDENVLAKAARQKFMEYGAASTKQLKLKDYTAILDWAQNYEIPRN